MREHRGVWGQRPQAGVGSQPTMPSGARQQQGQVVGLSGNSTQKRQQQGQVVGLSGHSTQAQQVKKQPKSASVRGEVAMSPRKRHAFCDQR
ncbi:MAG: hypothetical protein CL920_34390 [Deltaproteobacteria bacterium]|nr:hypothetical protein [Deltaproteobacteria bacterium]MBU53814.1 hypothetical protein [Deltaproteobacteria bacterium]